MHEAHAPAENEGKNKTNAVDAILNGICFGKDDDSVLHDTHYQEGMQSDTQEGGIKKETDDSQGDKKSKRDVYWCVSKEDNTVYGTTRLAEASSFHIITTGDSKYPSEFFIVHWQGDRQLVTNVNDPEVRSRPKMTNLPLYLTTNTGIFGKSEGPLQLKSTVLTNQARFCLHSRVQSTFACMMCLSTPVSLSDWIEGEQFYINCSRRAFKIDGYIAMAMVKLASEGQVHQYKTVTLPSISDPSCSSTEAGMLFRLKSPEIDKSKTVNPTDDTEKSKELFKRKYLYSIHVPIIVLMHRYGHGY